MVPCRDQIYTVREINELTLKDSPFLRVPIPEMYGVGRIVPIQGDLTPEVVELLADLPFVYQKTTDEWIPLFKFKGQVEDLMDLLDFEPERDPYSDTLECWVTVKGHYVEQYYGWDETRTRLTDPQGISSLTEDGFYPAKDWLIEAQRKVDANK